MFPTLRSKRFASAVGLNMWAQDWLNRNCSTYPKNNPLLDPYTCQHMVDEVHRSLNVDHSFGGYFEDRSTLWAGSYLEEKDSFLHLGVDFNVPIGTPVIVDRSCEVFIVDHDPSTEGGWGTRVLVILPEDQVMLIYAHLSPHVFCQKGRKMLAGDTIGLVGDPSHNGNWFPHLHVQAMTVKASLAYLEGSQPHFRFSDELDGYGRVAEMPTLGHQFPNPMRFVSV